MKHCSFWSLLIMALAVTCTAIPLGASNARAQEEQAETPAETSATETEKPANEAAPAVEEAATETTTAASEMTDEEKAKAEEAAQAAADAAPISTKTFTYVVNTAIMFLCAVLVLLMQAGFALVEVGLNSAKNAANILAKNLMDLCVGALIFLLVGFGLMYPGDAMNESKTFGFGGIGLGGFGYQEKVVDGNTVMVIDGDDEKLSANYAPSADFMFQVAFAATAATIVSGAVAGRMQFAGYLIYTLILTGFVYPISGMWKWGEGWLFDLGFQDFAGSIVVHAVGGFAGLAGAMLLGPRIGRYVNGKSIPMPGHNIIYAGLGVFLLWIGWYGFNSGSQLNYASTLSISHTVYIAATTTIAAAAGAVAAMILVWIMFGKPDVSMMLNGALAGLVGITANCDNVTLLSAILIGAIAGVIVVLGVVLLDKLKIDDPVGAFPVHGLCGVWGGIATGIFGVNIPEAVGDRFGFIKVQLIGTVAIVAWAFLTMLVVFGILKVIGMLRVSPEHELEGLDITEHGMHAYPPSWVAADDFGAGPSGASPAMYSKSPRVAQVEVSPGNA